MARDVFAVTRGALQGGVLAALCVCFYESVSPVCAMYPDLILIAKSYMFHLQPF